MRLGPVLPDAIYKGVLKFVLPFKITLGQKRSSKQTTKRLKFDKTPSLVFNSKAGNGTIY